MSAVCFSLCRPTQIKVNEKPADKLISGRWFWSFTALINCPWRPLAQQQNYKMKMIWAAIRWLPILSLLPIESPKMSMYRKFYTVFLELFSIMRTHFPLLDHFFWFLSHSVCLSGAVIAVWNLLADNFCQFWQINVCRLWFIWWSECCYRLSHRFGISIYLLFWELWTLMALIYLFHGNKSHETTATDELSNGIKWEPHFCRKGPENVSPKCYLEQFLVAWSSIGQMKSN